jgi:hypothetical protein
MRVSTFSSQWSSSICAKFYIKKWWQIALEIEISCSQWEDPACTRGYNFFFFILRKGGVGDGFIRSQCVPMRSQGIPIVSLSSSSKGSADGIEDYCWPSCFFQNQNHPLQFQNQHLGKKVKYWTMWNISNQAERRTKHIPLLFFRGKLGCRHSLPLRGIVKQYCF